MENLSTIQQINQSIMFGTWSDTELNSMIDAIKWNRAQLQKQVKRSISLGQAVKFTSNRNGITYKGTVRKIAVKFITVDTGSVLFRVPANMLEVV